MSEVRKGDRLSIFVWRFVITAFILTFWEWSARRGWIDKFFISTPYEIFKKVGFWLVTGEIYSHLLVTLEETLLGFLLGAVLGIMVGFLFAFSPRVAKAFDPLLVSLNAMPRVVFYPLFVMWFGLGIESKVFFSATLVFFIIFFNTYAGLKEVDQNIVHQAKILGASTRDMVKHVYFPSALAWIFSSLRISVGFSLVGAIVGEYISSMKGVGRIIAYAESMFNANEVLAGLLLLVSFIVAIDIPMRWVEKRFSLWKIES
jgi:NitT/TauT family transport system permease protein